jgi:hypothetical protein
LHLRGAIDPSAESLLQKATSKSFQASQLNVSLQALAIIGFLLNFELNYCEERLPAHEKHSLLVFWPSFEIVFEGHFLSALQFAYRAFYLFRPA